MNFDYTIGGVVGSFCSAVFLLVWAKRRIATTEKLRRNQFELEKREVTLRQKEMQSSMKLEFKERELEREDKRQKDLQVQLDARLKEVEREESLLSDAEHEAEKMRRLYRLKIHQITQMKREEARQLLIRSMEKECEQEIRAMRRDKLDRAEAEITDEAKRVLLAAMQRITSEPMNDASATVVNLPSEEMKGRVIGRDGRNIRSFEHATGTTLMIDEAPDSVLISCFDPVRREIARFALEALLRDGRIHPSSIEEQVDKAQGEMQAKVTELGEGALRELRLDDVHPEVVTLLGKLHYRLSNNQNTLAHCVEVAKLCGLIASEIGLDSTTAKRAGLFHDIGKALAEEYEGSHAAAGAEIIKQYGEDTSVVNAVAAHHKEVPAESVYAGLVMAADALSASRPGARASSIDGFIQRVRSIEEIASARPGVSEAYAVQAGRELRVIVEPEIVNDEEARLLARKIRKDIEEQMNYPGKVEITVIREQRYTETAV
ncbi:MAG: ribonuclease Y [Verrucomicrobiota bacterium]|nr:ribonuclease Y [Verrucomicrobiota bacterium]